MNFKGKMREKSGITLITLVVTIIVLLILAGITIATITSDNGIIKNANDAKEQTEIAEEKEIVDRATIQAMGNNKRGNLVQDELQEQLDKITDNGKTEVSDNGEEFEVVFVDSNRYYTVDKDGNIVEEGKIVIDKSPGDITKDENGNTLKGDESEPYEIWCIEDLVEWSENYQNYQNSNIILGRTLNFKSNYSYSNGKMLGCNSIEELKDLLTNTSGSGFTPITNFHGTFDGKNFEIQNIYENVSGKAGFFADAAGTIKNLKISGNIISNDGYAGGIVSNLGETLNISNCINYCNVTANAEIHTNPGNVYVHGTAGGIVGNCVGNVIIIKDCANEGNIYGTNETGGIVGFQYVSNITILNCYNDGMINGESDTGGIIGRTMTSTVQIYNCYNIGNISGSVTGGLIGNRGSNDKIEIKNCYNYSEIKGSKYQGEIIGFNWAYDTETSPTIENVFYTNQTIGAFGGFANAIGTPVYCEDISDNNFVTQLNDYVSSVSEQDILWKSWVLGKEGYPIFE